jgi:hypothetical protein
MSGSIPALFVLLRANEYHTLLNKGLLHALPTTRFLTTAQTQDFASLLQALPAGEDLRTPWLLLAALQPGSPLDISHTDLTHVYPLSNEQAQDLLPESLKSNPAVASWFHSVRQVFSKIVRILKEYPHGVMVVPRFGNQRPEQSKTLPFTIEQFIAPSQLRQLEAWSRAIPDIDDDDYAIILPLRQPLGSSPATVSSQFTGQVMPLTERGAQLLRQQAGYTDLLPPPPTISDVLDLRRQAEAAANAARLSNLVPLKISDRKKLTQDLISLDTAARQRRGREASPQNVDPIAPITFWDALLDYDRTGADAEMIPDNDRGILLDLTFVSRRFLSAQKERNALGDKAAAIRLALNSWGQFAQNPAYDTSAFTVFNAKSPAKNSVKDLNTYLGGAGLNTLAAGYSFLFLLRSHGHHEQEFTTKTLHKILTFATANNLEKELALALYALGLILPAGRFLSVFRNPSTSLLPVSAPTSPASKPTKKAASAGDKRISAVEPTSSAVLSTSTEGTRASDSDLFSPEAQAPERFYDLNVNQPDTTATTMEWGRNGTTKEAVPPNPQS